MHVTTTQSKHIQILRGLAILAVVLIHNTPAGISQVIIRPFLNFCVGLFLFLSGLLSDRKSWNPKKRIIKVLVPYIIWTFIYVCSGNLNSLSQIPIEYLKSLLAGNAAAIMYYIFVYCQLTLLIPFIDKLANSKYKYLGFLISPLEILVMRTLPIILGYQINKYLQIIIGLSCLGWFTYFYLGYLIANKKISVNIHNRSLVILLIVSILVQMLESYWYYSLGNTNCGTQLKITTLVSGVIFALIAYKFINAPKPYHSKLLTVLGNYSFGIYFSHPAILIVLRAIPLYTKYVLYPLNAVVTILLSFAICYIGKKILKKHSWMIAL